MSDSREILLKRLEADDQMPSLPVALAPLLRYFKQPLDSLDVQEVADLASQDKSLSAQCLRMANSPLFGRWQQVDSIRSAVVALGMQKMRDIVVSCSVLKLTPRDQAQINPTVFWEHSLTCALVSRQFARKIGFADEAKAYLAGLLHDLGVLVNLWIIPEDFGAALAVARAEQIPLHEAELRTLKISHCDAGAMLASKWGLPEDLVTVIASHHEVENAINHRALISVVCLSDLLCRMGGLGYGYVEERQVNLLEEPAFSILLSECPKLRTFDWARFTFELEAYLEEVRGLVALLYRAQ